MVELISRILGLVWREQWALQNFFDGLGELITGGGARGVAATFMMIMQMFNMLVTGSAVDPWGPELDLSGYELVFEDEFDGAELDMNIWRASGDGSSRAGYSSISQCEVKDGNLIMTGEYLTDGVYGEGWYGSSIALNETYKRGYFECRMIAADSNSFWSAFWINGVKSSINHETSKGGIESVEIDIMESLCHSKEGKHNAVEHAIHLAGLGGSTEGYQSRNLGAFNGKDIYNEYNTYGMMWTENEYIFYINGVETTRSTFGEGICINPEVVLLSLCVPGASKFEGKSTDEACEMKVDYVRIYQLAG